MIKLIFLSIILLFVRIVICQEVCFQYNILLNMNLSLNVFMFQVPTPIAFLHIGPHKTASTQIQTTFIKYSLEKNHNIFLSSEEFDNMNIEQLQRLQFMLK